MLVIRVLGPLELEVDGKPVEVPRRRPARLLLGYLALRRGPHTRGDLAAALWPGTLESSARASLRSALAAARRSLGQAADSYIVRAGDTVGLAGPELVAVDVELFDALVAEGRPDHALELARGPLLQGLGADFITALRAERLARTSDLLGELARREEERGALDRALEHTRAQVALDPLAEPPNRELIRRLAASGDRASALAAYAELSDRFRTELRTVPSAPTRRLADDVRRGATEAAQDGPTPLPPGLAAADRGAFVDREDALRALGRAAAAAAKGEPRVALVSGVPGVGKSALAAHFAAAAAGSATVLLGRCREEVAAPLEPFADALRHYAAGASADRLQRELPPAAAELGGLVPELADHAPARALPADLLADGGRLERAVAETVLAAARERLLVVVLEDVHAARPAAARVIERLVAAEGARLLLVLTVRETELARAPPAQRLVRRLRRAPGVVPLALGPFDRAAVGSLARALRGSDVDPALVDRVHARSEGHPLFASELLASAREPEDNAGSPLPEPVQDFVLDEIGRLAPDARAALSVASAIGSEFDLATVAAVAEMPEQRALDALDEAVLARVVRELPDRIGRYEFRHSLIREGVYESLTATRRAHLHRAIAAAGGASAAQPSAIVGHLERAGELVSPVELADHVARAAAAASEQGAYHDAGALYARACEALEPDAAHAVRRCELLVSLGHARRRAGEGDAGRESFRAAGGLARRLGRADLLRAAAEGICTLPFSPGDQPADRSAIAILEDALAELPPSEGATRARLLARLASERYYEAAPAETDSLAREALELARTTGDRGAMAAVLEIGHLASRPVGGARERLALAGRLVESARADGDAESLVRALVRRNADRVELGEVRSLESSAEELLALAAEHDQPAYGWWAHLWRATAAILGERAGEGERQTRRAYEVGRVAFGEAADVELRAQLAWIRLEQGRLAELAPAIPGLDALFAELPTWACFKARILCDVGRGREAAASVEQLTRTGIAGLARDSNWLVSAALLAEVCARTRDAAAAAELSRALADRSDDWVISARGTVFLGPVAGSLALLAAVEGREEDAASRLASALARCREAGATAAAARLEREFSALSRAMPA
ncbi:MAG: ATP-binding protein [Thermoleophilaceae bacterium]